MRHIIFAASLCLMACQSAVQSTDSVVLENAVPSFVDLSLRDKPDAITTDPWSEVVINVPDPESFSQLFTEIGGYETLLRTETDLVLRATDSDSGAIRLRKVDATAQPTRPLDARAWDTGCYWSVMMRAKDVESIVSDAAAFGWLPHAPITFLKFGPSELHVVVLGHQETGVQLQLYERLTTPLPENFPEFERISMPFNLMQMVEDRDATYNFVQQGLGFETFYYGKPYLATETENMPLGLPKELTTEIAYEAAIVYPNKGDEVGRLEMISFAKDERIPSRDFSALCQANNIGIIEVRFPVEHINDAAEQLTMNTIAIHQVDEDSVMIKAPDGGFIRFVSKKP